MPVLFDILLCIMYMGESGPSLLIVLCCTSMALLSLISYCFESN